MKVNDFNLLKINLNLWGIMKLFWRNWQLILPCQKHILRDYIFNYIMLYTKPVHTLLFFYCCSIAVVSIFPHYYPLPYPTPKSPIQLPPPLLSLFMGPLYKFLDLTPPLLSPLNSLPLFWSLSVCSSFPCFWFCFAHLFVLLIGFHL